MHIAECNCTTKKIYVRNNEDIYEKLRSCTLRTKKSCVKHFSHKIGKNDLVVRYVILSSRILCHLKTKAFKSFLLQYIFNMISRT